MSDLTDLGERVNGSDIGRAGRCDDQERIETRGFVFGNGSGISIGINAVFIVER